MKRNTKTGLAELKIFLTISFLLLIISCNTGVKDNSDNSTNDKYHYNRTAKLENKAKEAFTFVSRQNMNQDFCILIDMEIHSGLNRFFVWSFNENKVVRSLLVSHGCGTNPWSGDRTKESPQFSNVENSHLSSLGKYRIGERGYSQWGVHTKYSLYGLEPTNRNAMKRAIVFHSWDSVSDKEVYPKGTPEGWGCPAISNDHFRAIDELLKSSSKPTLMWIYN